MKITLQIDCEPMNRHQEELGRAIFRVILKQEYREPDSCFFGNWQWDNISCTKSQREQIYSLLESCYNAGDIRYGSC